MSTGPGRRWLSLFALALIGAGAWHAWSSGWFEHGVPVEAFVPAPAPAPVVADPEAAAAHARELDERRRHDDLRAVMMAMRDAESIANAERRCLAMPDPPESRWPAGAAAARCTLLRKPVLTLAVMRELLSRGTPGQVRRMHADLLAAHFEDPARREQIFLAYQQFDDSDAAAAVAASWLRNSPRDPFALTAAGWQQVSEVAALRGAADSVPGPANLAAMQALATRTWPLLDAALAAEPKMMPACVAMARLARLTGDHARQQQGLRQCLAIDPLAFHVLQEQAEGAQPRWGGSLSALEVVATQAQAEQGRYPLLAGLVALPQVVIAEQAPPAQAANRWQEALRPGPPAPAALAAAAATLQPGDPWQALLLLSQAGRFDPCRECNRRTRLPLLLQLQEWDWARSEAQSLLIAKPDDWALLGTLWQAREGLAVARGAPPGAVQPAAVWLTPFEGCLDAIAHFAERAAEAKACSTQIVAERPDNAYSWYLRVRYLRAAGERGVEVALRQMEAALDRSRPEQMALLDLARAGQARPNPNLREWSKRPG